MPPRLRPIGTSSVILHVSPRRCNVCFVSQISKPLSTTASCQTRQRRSMFMWLESQGRNFLDPLTGSTNYLGAYDPQGRLKRLSVDDADKRSDRSQSKMSVTGNSSPEDQLPPETAGDLVPFPQNRTFRSQPIINETMRESIWGKIMKDRQSVKAVSAELGVEMSRVGAVVRLKEIEKEWARQGRRLAKPYAKAVMEMLPQTKYPYDSKSRSPQAHESINDLPVHAATMQQIFHPTSESREFTRTDAAKVFDEALLPADLRVPHPELAYLERDRLSGMPYRERVEKAASRDAEAQQRRIRAEQRRKEKEERAVKLVNRPRWDFKFREVSVDDAGMNGRGHKGTGWRYGVPHMDRRKGEVKIPTRVE